MYDLFQLNSTEIKTELNVIFGEVCDGGGASWVGKRSDYKLPLQS